MNYNWKRWKLGLVVAVITGLASAGVALSASDHIGWKGLLLVLGYNVGQNVLLFLNQHPVDSVSDTTVTPNPNPPKP